VTRGTQWARTVRFSGERPHELPPALAELTEQVFAACRERFPGSLRYHHSVERDRGVVQGHRLHVERNGFRGVVAVQWYPRVHSYRQDRDGGLEVRIGGRARIEPVVTTTRHTEVDVHVHGRVLGLGVALVLGIGGAHTMRLVMSHPSATPVLDVLGIAAAVLAMCGAVWLLRVVANGRWWRRVGVSRATTPDDAASDLGRWRALGSDVGQLPLRDP
jgi:hypothetical protein